jgi:hypothetical protein
LVPKRDRPKPPVDGLFVRFQDVLTQSQNECEETWLSGCAA